MANRHKQFKRPAKYLGEGKSNKVEKEALQTRAYGGKVDGGKVCDMPSGKTPKRAHGGRVGADKSPMSPGVAKHPWSSAHRGK